MEILLRSSWQAVNIGDIAHTPAMLALIEKYLSNTKVTVWASEDITKEIIKMEHKRFPYVKFVTGDSTKKEVMDAINRADFFLHGSGPYLAGAKELNEFLKYSNKPYGVFGITYRDNPEENELLSGAQFVYFRDSISLKSAQNKGICAKVMKFGPDAAFATDLKNEEKAEIFLKDKQLKEKEFICCIPRLRFTPYWEIRNTPYDSSKDYYNQLKKEQDHIYLRKTIEKVIRKTGIKVLICPEDMTQIKLGKEELYDKLPENIKKNVVLRDTFWLTDEAVSIYKKSLGLFGNEMHSPIMCIGNDIPAVVCRWKEQTSKGYMWKDIGLSEWLYDTDEGIDINDLSENILKFVTNQNESQEKAKKANNLVKKYYSEIMKEINMFFDFKI